MNKWILLPLIALAPRTVWAQTQPVVLEQTRQTPRELFVLPGGNALADFGRAAFGQIEITARALSAGDTLNAVLPLGRGFTPAREGERLLLVGGGVGVAPLLQLGKEAQRAGAEVTFLLGARSAEDLLQLPLFERYGRVFVTTEDGTAGERGFVTQHSLLSAERFSRIAVCGPKPMMVAVARYAKSSGTPCEVSLENMMACGVGACLCCVEDTTEGYVCVCTEGPVFNIERLKWQI